jgi:retron-type reverse transcriptase
VFLDELRSQVKDRGFRPLPVREWMIPKAGGKLRRLGITAMRDRVVQASLKLASSLRRIRAAPTGWPKTWPPPTWS